MDKAWGSLSFQMVRNFRKPLVVVAPKVLLRLPAASSSLNDMGPGTCFQPVVGEPGMKSDKVTRLIFCSGKHYYTIQKELDSRNIDNTAVIRLEVSWLQECLLLFITLVFISMCIVFSSPEPKAHRWAYRILMVRRPSFCPSSVRPKCSKIFFSKTAWPIKAKFYVEPPWVGGMKVCSQHLGHMTKMAAMPTYGKNSSKIFSRTGRPIFTKLGM